MDIAVLPSRLPFFLTEFFALSWIAMTLGCLAALIWYGLLFPLSLIVGVPLAIISSALSNKDKLSGYVEVLVELFWKIPIEVIVVVVGNYRSLLIWFVKGEEQW